MLFSEFWIDECSVFMSFDGFWDFGVGIVEFLWFWGEIGFLARCHFGFLGWVFWFCFQVFRFVV